MVHFRVGKTDGVSLEMANWKEILTQGGWRVEMCAGPQSVGADYVIENFEAQLNPTIFRLDEEAFGGFKTMKRDDFEAEFRRIQEDLSTEFMQVIKQARPDRVIVSNVFSVGENIAAAGALAPVLKKAKVPTVAVHHDFWWENVRLRRPSCEMVADQLERFFPPVNGWLKHAVINRIARLELARRKGVFATLLHDCLDFDWQNEDKNGACKKMLEAYGVTGEDLVVVQGTRIVRRKNIEISMDLVRRLEKRVDELGRRRVVLVMAGYAEKRDEEYLEKLRVYARDLGIHTVELNGLANSYNQATGEKCDLLGIYPYADVVTYPSEYEGFGNQFLEAIYAQKPIVVYEYPVFKTDIKPLGFEVISLGDRLRFDPQTRLAKIGDEELAAAAERVVEVVRNADVRRAMTRKNFALGAKHFSFAKAAAVWKGLLA